MQESTTSNVAFQSTSAKDVMTAILREGARQAPRNGHLPQRTITTGIAEVPLRQPRVRDRRPHGERVKFTSKILPAYLRKTKSIEDLIPWLYLKGVSSGDFPEALAALLGPHAAGLSASTVRRLKSH